MKLYNEHYPNSLFEIFGFFKEVWLNDKFMGTIDCDIDLERTIGYCGRTEEYWDVDIITNTKNKIPARTIVKTLYYPYNGVALKKLKHQL